MMPLFIFNIPNEMQIVFTVVHFIYLILYFESTKIPTTRLSTLIMQFVRTHTASQNDNAYVTVTMRQ